VDVNNNDFPERVTRRQKRWKGLLNKIDDQTVLEGEGKKGASLKE